MTFSKDDKRPLLQARADPALVERVEEFADQHDTNKSAVLREAVEHYLPGGEEHGPADPTLRKTYLWLRDRADPEGRVPTDAVGDLAQEHSIDKKYLKSSRLQPLSERGWIVPEYRYIRVLEPDERNQLRPNPNDD